MFAVRSVLFANLTRLSLVALSRRGICATAARWMAQTGGEHRSGEDSFSSTRSTERGSSGSSSGLHWIRSGQQKSPPLREWLVTSEGRPAAGTTPKLQDALEILKHFRWGGFHADRFGLARLPLAPPGSSIIAWPILYALIACCRDHRESVWQKFVSSRR